MKKLLLTALTLAGFTAGVFAQGTFFLNNSSSANGLATDTAGNFYTGVAGLEIWELNQATVPAGFNALANTAAYAAMTTAGSGWKLETTLTGQSINTGSIAIGGQILAPDVNPAGSTVVIALAAWNTADTSWISAVAAAGTKAGVLAFSQATGNPNAIPPGTPANTMWPGADLVMTPVPEPSMFALAGLGAAALLIFRRRK